MIRSARLSSFGRAAASLALFSLLAVSAALAANEHRTSTFTGSKVNAGWVLHEKLGTKTLLTLSNEFVTPETPDPHWQVVDSKGQTYLLQRLMIKGDKLNRTIEVPAYVRDVAKVQIWCAFAEVVLGESSFPKPVM